jgi:hypothetical protein
LFFFPSGVLRFLVTVHTKLLVLIPLVLGALLAACGGGDGKKFPDTVVIGDDDIRPELVSQELVAGKNRFAFALIDQQSGQLILDADVHMAFYRLYDDGREEKRFELDAISSVPARDAGIEEVIEHVHPDGTVHIHANVGDQVGIYTAVVDFDEAGRWGVELQIDTGERKDTINPSFSVGGVSTTLAIGADAPHSVNRTVDDVDDISLIDSSADPTELMHTETIADALDAGRPLLVLFAVPGYCTSQLCGPEYAIMRKLYPQYSNRVSFIHVEPFEVPSSPDKVLVQAAKDFGLQTEPWFFVIDAQGKLSMKFEGPTSMQELEDALADVLG